MNMQFKPGDIVRLLTGTAPAIVVHARRNALRVRYLSTHRYDNDAEPLPWRHADNYTLHTPAKETLPKMPPIFALKSDSTAIGNVLAQNSAGLAVFELRSTLEIILVAPSDIEEVRPYTFKTHRNEHYATTPNTVALSDILFIGNTMHCVTQLDTRADHYNALPASTRKIPTLEL